LRRLTLTARVVCAGLLAVAVQIATGAAGAWLLRLSPDPNEGAGALFAVVAALTCLLWPLWQQWRRRLSAGRSGGVRADPNPDPSLGG